MTDINVPSYKGFPRHHFPATIEARRESATEARRERVERAKVIIVATLNANGNMGIFKLARASRVPIDITSRAVRELEEAGTVVVGLNNRGSRIVRLRRSP
jgi:predicted transcriptional regulator